MLFPINVDVPMTRLPVANWVLIGVICFTTFLGAASTDVVALLAGIEHDSDNDAFSLEDLQELSEEEIQTFFQEAAASGQLELGLPPVFDPPWWRLPMLAITSTLLHADLFHLIGNMLFLWTFGNAINYKFGHLSFLGLFCLAGLVAGLMFYWTDPGVGLVGASGAIMGIVGAYLVFFPRNDVTMAFWYIFGYETFSLPSWIMIVLWFGFDLFYLLNGAQTGVAYVAHVAGFSTGFVIACLLAWYEVLVPTRYEQTLLEVFGIH